MARQSNNMVNVCKINFEMLLIKLPTGMVVFLYSNLSIILAIKK